jgi:hypothetical protein
MVQKGGGGNLLAGEGPSMNPNFLLKLAAEIHVKLENPVLRCPHPDFLLEVSITTACLVHPPTS